MTQQTNGEQTMSDKLKPCPNCGDRDPIHPEHEYSEMSDVECNNEQCNFHTPIEFWNTLPRQELSELERKWLALAPEFDTDTYEYEWNATVGQSDVCEYWGRSEKAWIKHRNINAVTLQLIRRKKAPVWAVGDGFEDDIGDFWLINQLHQNGSATCIPLSPVTHQRQFETILRQHTRIPHNELMKKYQRSLKDE